MKPKSHHSNQSDQTIPITVQKFSWEQVAKFSTFEEADQKRNELKAQGKLTKVRLMGNREWGTNHFSVKVGKPIKKEEAVEKVLKNDAG